MLGDVLRKHEYALRRWHSLTGIVPVGGYLLIHLFINSRALAGAEAFHQAVRFVNALPGGHLLEICFIYAPLAFHAAYGILIASQAHHNVARYRYPRNWAFFLQRLTGIITLLYLTQHLWQFRLQKLLGAYGPYQGGISMSGLPTYAIVQAAMANNLIAALSVIGVVAAAYHLCNGFLTFLISWGITVGPTSQRVLGVISYAAFVAISAFGVVTIWAFR